jgi:phage terminase large subunit-like protein
MFQPPNRFTPPLSKDFESDGYALIRLVELAWRSPENPDGLKLDEWQKWLLIHLLERNPASHQSRPGLLRYRQVVVSMGRQNGKSVLGAILGLYGLLMHEPGAQVLSLASSTEQATIIYDRVLYVIRNNPSLAKRFRRTTETRGIVTADGGSRYHVKPAKESALQGIPASLVLFDELHLANKGMWSASVLGTSQRANGLVVGITTAGDESSVTLAELYEFGSRSCDGDPSLDSFGFFCWEAPLDAEITSPDAIRAANPAVAAGRIPIDRVIADLQTIPEVEARRYRLNQFVAGSVESWLPGKHFNACAGQGVESTDGIVLAVDRTRYWDFVTVAAARKVDGIIQTELVASISKPNESQLFDFLKDLYEKHRAQAIAFDGVMFPDMVKRFKMRGFTTYELYSKEVAAAASTGYALFSNQSIIHANEPLLRSQILNGVAKYTGDTWRISRRDSRGEIDALMATLFAVYVAHTREGAVLQYF